MDLELRRQPSTDACTLGTLFIDGTQAYFTLEPRDGGLHPDIPAGVYRVQINYSIRFQRLLPVVIGVPGRLGIRIHPGNTAEDTEGCILLGLGHTVNAISNSREACAAFQSTIAKPLARGETVTLTILNAPVEALRV